MGAPKGNKFAVGNHNAGAPVGNQNAVGNQGGAPEKYTSEWLEQEAQRFLEWMKHEDSLYFKSFAVERGYHPNRLQEFADKSIVFSGALELAKAWQEQKLIKGGLLNKYNSSITKFCLTNCHGFSEKTEVSGNAANPLGFLLQMVDGRSKDLLNEDECE